MKLVWTEYAVSCLREISDFISVDNPGAAEKLVIKIFDLADSLTEIPERGRIVPEKNDSAIREIIYRNYRIIYRIKKGEIQVLSVLEGSRLLKKEDIKNDL